MSSYPPNSASRRPEGSWPPPEEEDFRIVPPPGVSAPPSSASVSMPPPMAAPPAPPPPPPRPAPLPVPMPAPVVAPPPTRQVARPAQKTDRSKMWIAIGAGVVLLAAVAFFLYFELVLNKATGTTGTAGTATAAAKTGQPSQLAGVATNVAIGNWPTAIPGCSALYSLQTIATPVGQDSALLSQSFFGCGKQLVSRDHPQKDVETALQYFEAANKLTPNNPDIQHQIDLANKYLGAMTTLAKPDEGGFIDQMEANFVSQPEFKDAPYADSMTRLYGALLDSGNNGLLLKKCDVAQHRYGQAVALAKYVDTTEARRKLQTATTACP